MKHTGTEFLSKHLRLVEDNKKLIHLASQIGALVRCEDELTKGREWDVCFFTGVSNLQTFRNSNYF